MKLLARQVRLARVRWLRRRRPDRLQQLFCERMERDMGVPLTWRPITRGNPNHITGREA